MKKTTFYSRDTVVVYEIATGCNGIGDFRQEQGPIMKREESEC
ncbi:MAG TPA: hypothetical protein VMS89_04655 [Methanoregulaceae archaeon]|nr:hypothetical protein [Methanoregulaceae archaeon]